MTDAITGGWHDGEGNTPPAHVTYGKSGLAKGKLEAMLVKGGPTGAWVWAHFHGRHKDRHGETHFNGYVTVTDDSGFSYMVTPSVSFTVKGVLDKPDRNKHKWAQFTASGETATWLKMAVDQGTTLHVNCHASRDRNDVNWIANQFKGILKGYLEGNTPYASLLRELNAGKTPQINR